MMPAELRQSSLGGAHDQGPPWNCFEYDLLLNMTRMACIATNPMITARCSAVTAAPTWVTVQPDWDHATKASCACYTYLNVCHFNNNTAIINTAYVGTSISDRLI
jgi:hypothetical protein